METGETEEQAAARHAASHVQLVESYQALLGGVSTLAMEAHMRGAEILRDAAKAKA